MPKFNFNRFVIDLHSFFKYSVSSVARVFENKREADIYPQNMQQCVTTRWISLQNVLVRILEPLENLKEYYLNVLPSQKQFKENDIGRSERNVHIKYIENLKIETIMSVVVYIV